MVDPNVRTPEQVVDWWFKRMDSKIFSTESMPDSRRLEMAQAHYQTVMLRKRKKRYYQVMAVFERRIKEAKTIELIGG